MNFIIVNNKLDVIARNIKRTITMHDNNLFIKTMDWNDGRGIIETNIPFYQIFQWINDSKSWDKIIEIESAIDSKSDDDLISAFMENDSTIIRHFQDCSNDFDVNIFERIQIIRKQRN